MRGDGALAGQRDSYLAHSADMDLLALVHPHGTSSGLHLDAAARHADLLTVIAKDVAQRRLARSQLLPDLSSPHTLCARKCRRH